MKVVFAHPCIPARFNGVPYGMLQVATAVEQQGHEVVILDYQAKLDALPSIREVVEHQRPDIVALSSTSPSHFAAVQLAIEVKSVSPSTLVVKGGVHETYCGLHTVANVPEIDIVLRGDADYSFIELLNRIKTNTDKSDVPGIVFRQSNDIRWNAQIPSVPLTDALPRPNRTLLGNDDPYRFKIFGGKRTTQVQTMRGCPFQCTFCNQRNRVRVVRSVPHVAEELADLQASGYEAVFFDDATFTVNRNYTLDLMRTIVRDDINLEFACQTRAALLDAELADAMAEAGFKFVSFGLETTNRESLARYLKTKSVERHIEDSVNAIRHCRKNGIQSGANIIVGFEGETPQSMHETFRFVADVAPDFASLSALALYPHEQTGLEDIYLAGTSMEPIWQNFDEGFGAIHPYLTAEEAVEKFNQARSVLGSKLDVV